MGKKILIVFGTRPEGIKMAPLVRNLLASAAEVRVCVTGQHKEMLQQVLNIFDIQPDYDLQVMKQGQDLFDVTSRVLLGMREVLTAWTPDVVVVHGDTTTSVTATLAAFYMKVPVAHVEAGLRTGNLYDPWPEEANRVLTGRLASLHFAPTATSQSNLLGEGVAAERIFVTGNTVIDALLYTVRRIEGNQPLLNRSIATIKTFGYSISDRRFVLITGHRRENFGQRFTNIFTAIKVLAKRFAEVDFVYPVHLNPNVSEPARKILGGIANVYLMAPLEYEPFVYLMSKAHLIITDSGGIQEEAPSLGKPVLVLRDTTERPEAVEAGTVRLVGTDQARIVDGVANLLESNEDYDRMSKAHNPYGDGHAADRIARVLLEGC